MKITFTKYPIDIIICIIWTNILLPMLLFSSDSNVQTLLSLPFLFFIPGYVFIFALFPIKKGNKGIDKIERIGLSFGFSIALVSLIGLILNYTPWLIRLEPILFSLYIFTVTIAVVGFYRWKMTPIEQRFYISFEITIPRSNNKSDAILTIILGISLIIVTASVIYVIVTPKTGEKFTEFYILGPNRNTTNYPRYLKVNENASIIIGLVNHEDKIMNYSIEIWLINQTILFNESTQNNETIYNHMWYMGNIIFNKTTNKTTVEIPQVDISKNLSQWNWNYNFSVNKTGEFKLTFLLFTTQPQKYNSNLDYNYIAEQKIQSAYKEVHLWITITKNI